MAVINIHSIGNSFVLVTNCSNTVSLTGAYHRVSRAYSFYWQIRSPKAPLQAGSENWIGSARHSNWFRSSSVAVVTLQADAITEQLTEIRPRRRLEHGPGPAGRIYKWRSNSG